MCLFTASLNPKLTQNTKLNSTYTIGERKPHTYLEANVREQEPIRTHFGE